LYRDYDPGSGTSINRISVPTSKARVVVKVVNKAVSEKTKRELKK